MTFCLFGSVSGSKGHVVSTRWTEVNLEAGLENSSGDSREN